MAGADADARVTLPPHVSVPDYTSQIIKPYTALRRHPAPRAPLDTELLFGQGVDVYEIDKGLALVKVRPLIGSSERPLYIGYVKASAIAAQLKLSDTGQGNKSYVTALAAPVFLKADMKSHIIMALPMNSIIRGYGEDEKFIQMAKGYIHKKHVSPAPIFDDFVVAAAKFMGRPYIWGGTGGLGVDCSGLVQMALCASGIDAPRDADQQEMYLGDDITGDPYQRGDLIFWAGHVGIMQNSAELLHANAFHMKTSQKISSGCGLSLNGRHRLCLLLGLSLYLSLGLLGRSSCRQPCLWHRQSSCPLYLSRRQP